MKSTIFFIIISWCVVSHHYVTIPPTTDEFGRTNRSEFNQFRTVYDTVYQTKIFSIDKKAEAFDFWNRLNSEISPKLCDNGVTIQGFFDNGSQDLINPKIRYSRDLEYQYGSLIDTTDAIFNDERENIKYHSDSTYLIGGRINTNLDTTLFVNKQSLATHFYINNSDTLSFQNNFYICGHRIKPGQKLKVSDDPKGFISFDNWGRPYYNYYVGRSLKYVGNKKTVKNKKTKTNHLVKNSHER